jgi:DNA-binding NarL/FixJ family response regulator
MTGINVLIADDQHVVRLGLRLILEQLGFTVVAEASTGREAVDLAARHRPDVCLLDIRMPGLDGLAATRPIAGRSASHPIPVVVLTTFDHDEYLDEAISNGVSGFLLKDSGPTLLAEALHAAVRGDALIEPSMTIRYLRRRHQDLPAPTRSPELDKLSDRELEVVAAIAIGRTNDEIRADLFVSLSTVKSHVATVLTKLDLRNRVEIAAWAWQHGLVVADR